MSVVQSQCIVIAPVLEDETLPKQDMRNSNILLDDQQHEDCIYTVTRLASSLRIECIDCSAIAKY